MAVSLRLQRHGTTHRPFYKLVATDSRNVRDGRFLEILGSYNPRTEPFTFDVKEDRIYYWLSVGAQPSESVAKLFKSVGLDERFARVKAGEDAEKVLAEAKEYYANRPVEKKTRLAARK